MSSVLQKQFVEAKAKDYSGGKAVENSLKAYYSEVKKVKVFADHIHWQLSIE